MPVEQRPPSNLVRAVVIGAGALIAAVVVLVIFLWVVNPNPAVEVNLGDDTFDAGFAEGQAAEIAENGPILYSDVSGRGQNRPMWLNHFGTDDSIGWVAFDANPAGSEPGCFVEWIAEENLFTDPCSGTDFDAGGDGLTQFSWSIDEDGHLIVDLRPQE
ncbi:MAG: hypothetical protein JJLCMIEE_01020 [Acidimicrobiales bacterium]|nr:MAG: hypothetical protein EDR02_07525 [Actinomycetota bacterium]MBV6507962.1 hypothetical protein [Acidimicrobiales bacterium]RIK06935.1 MAG: hypothetical protein DCC48_05465 [Acidobacteriota bacterium]